MGARYIVGDVFDVLATLEPGSVDLVVSSPPFLALRSYLPADHVDKAKEIGSEATPGEFIDRMLDVVEACARVLAPHGSLVFELGDTYAGSGGAGGDYDADGWREGQPRAAGSSKFARVRKFGSEWEENHPYPVLPDSGPKKGAGWPLDKSKVLIPQLFAVALAYGFNPLTGRQTEPWRVRNTVAWCRPNPPVGRDGDKFRPATSFLTVACKARDRYWDGDAVRVPHAEHTMKYDGGTRPHTGERGGQGTVKEMAESAPVNPAGAPLLDWWNIPTEPYQGSHYATFPRKLVVPVIEAMAPRRVCRVCGEPSRRIVESVRGADPNRPEPYSVALQAQGMRHGWGTRTTGSETTYTTLGWSDCGHNNWRAGVVLDPFCGSGTTLQVATGHGRDAIGIDLDERNAELAVERIGGLFLTVEYPNSEPPATTSAPNVVEESRARFRTGYQAIGQDGPHGGPYRKPYGGIVPEKKGA